MLTTPIAVLGSGSDEFTRLLRTECDAEVEFVVDQHRFNVFLRNFQKTDCDPWMQFMEPGDQRANQIQR